MKCRVAWTACLLVFAPLEISAEPASVPLAAQAIASIRVDGNLSDWQGLKSTDAYQLPGNENLSGTLKILADQDALYFAIEIQDDKVIFGEEIFGASHLDDSVELHFGTNGDHVRISGDAEGRNPTIEGDFVFDSKVIQIPFLWEVLGVTAGIEKRSRGYSVEIRIPRDLLNAQEQVLLNLLVNDDDATGNIRTVNFFTVESMPFNIPQYSVNRVFPERIDVTKVGAKEFELTIGEARGYDFIHEVLAIVHMGDLQTIDVKLTQITKKERGTVKEMWVLHAQSYVKEEMGKYADALYLMQRIASETKDDRIGKSAELHIARLHERMGDTDKAIEQYRRIARNYGVDRHQEARYLHQIASIQARVGNQAAQLGTLHEILDRSEDVKEILNVRVRIAEAYLKTGNVKDAVAQYRHIRDNHSLDDPSELPNRLLYYIGGQFGWRITSDRQRQYPNLSESLKKAIDTRIARYFRVDGNFDAAIKQYERIQSNYHMSDAENVELWRNLGASYAGKGDYTRAIAEYRKIVEVGKTNSNDMLIDNGLEGIANLERKRGGWERMMQVLEAEVAQMQVPCVKVLLWMKKEYSEQGRHEKLQEMMIKHPDMFPPSRFEVLEGLCLIGQRQFLIGNYEQARSVLQEVINEGPPHQYAAMISSSYVGYLNEGGLEILQKGQKMINSKRYRDAAFFYKEIVDHIQEGNNHLHIKYYGDMLRRHGVFESVFSEYLDIMSSGQHQS